MAVKTVTCDQGKIQIFNQLIFTNITWFFDLYDNAIWPLDSDPADGSNFNIASYTGYIQQTVLVGGPTLQNTGPPGVAGQKAELGSQIIAFPVNLGSPVQIYGVFVRLAVSTGPGNMYVMAASAYVDDFALYPTSPVGQNVPTGAAPLPFLFNFRIWDFFQPTP